MVNRILLILTMVFICSNSVKAGLIGVVDYGNYFTDTSSGLDWLDVTITSGRSFNDVTSDLAEGNQFAGWRYASASDLSTMIANTMNLTGFSLAQRESIEFYEEEEHQNIAELSFLLGNTEDIFYLNAFGMTFCEYLINELGQTCTPEGTATTRGMLGELFTGIQDDLVVTAMLSHNDRSDDRAFATFNHHFQPDSTSLSVGSFLVRDSVVGVSEPPTLILMISLILLLWVRKKSNKTN